MKTTGKGVAFSPQHKAAKGHLVWKNTFFFFKPKHGGVGAGAAEL